MSRYVQLSVLCEPHGTCFSQHRWCALLQIGLSRELMRILSQLWRWKAIVLNALPSCLLCSFLAANVTRRQLFQFHHHHFLNQQSNAMPRDLFNGCVKISRLYCVIVWEHFCCSCSVARELGVGKDLWW